MKLLKDREYLQKNVFSRMLVQHCNRLPISDREFLSLEVFQTQVGKATTRGLENLAFSGSLHLMTSPNISYEQYFCNLYFNELLL